MQDPDQILTAAEMRAAEDAMMESGVSADELMQRAGNAAAEWVWRIAMGRAVTVLCGPGNNGGDGYVIAEALRARDLEVALIAHAPPRTAAAQRARTAWRGDVIADATGARGGVFVDCLFGSGLSRPLSEDHENLLAALSAQHEMTVAIDLPSGVATDDGALMGAVPRCDLTLALGAWKPAHFLMPALSRIGDAKLIDIGIANSRGRTRVFPRPRLSAPPMDAHKYSRGLVGVVGGTMPGAGLLAAQAAMHAGAGYVKLLSDHSHPAAPAALVVDGSPLGQVLGDERWSALLVGPGLGRDDAARARLGIVLERGVPTVVDADALHLLGDEIIEGIDTSRLLLTPHEGELARLCAAFAIPGTTKVARARALAGTTGMTVLAKGPDTVLAAADGRLAFFPPAPSWLSVAGTGDVLAGIAASRLADGRPPFEAAGQAVYLHAEAARLAGAAFAADDLVTSISAAYARFL